MTSRILVPLSQLDQSYLHHLGVTVGHVVRSVDTFNLRTAVARVIDKWRLLAGHPEWSQELSSWGIRVPLEGDVSNSFGFTTRKVHGDLDAHFLVNDDAPAEVLSRPPLKYFRPSSIPGGLWSYSKSKAPIVSLHVTELSNCTCIGISFPHGVLDAVGIGHFIRGLDHELNGRPWDAPAVSNTNSIRETLDSLGAVPPRYDIDTETTRALERSIRPASFINVLSHLIDIARENFLHHMEQKAVFLGEEAVANLVREAKTEVKDLGGVRISTSDILTAWIVKALYSREKDDTPVCLYTMCSIRAMFADKHHDPTIKAYPREIQRFIALPTNELTQDADNGFASYPMPPFTKRQLSGMSLVELAILHRTGLKSASEIAWLQAYTAYLKNTLQGRLVYGQRSGDESWICTNQVIGRLDQIDYGSPLSGVWAWLTPFEPGRFLQLNKLRGGYVIHANARATRWRSVTEAIQELKSSRLAP